LVATGALYHPVKRQKNNRLGIKGVSLRNSGKYCAVIQINGKTKYLGVFTTAAEASAAYAAAALERHGEFARTGAAANDNHRGESVLAA
jgi:hypothetical protein